VLWRLQQLQGAWQTLIRDLSGSLMQGIFMSFIECIGAFLTRIWLMYMPEYTCPGRNAGCIRCCISIALYEGVSKSFRTGRLERELRMAQLFATRCSCIAILWVSLVSFAAITLCVASQRVSVVAAVYFVTHSVRKLLGTPLSVTKTKLRRNYKISFTNNVHTHPNIHTVYSYLPHYPVSCPMDTGIK
jgi:hypothetical protein